MKLVKSLLLGSAAGLFAVAGAQAADLPAAKAAPIDYVRVCDAYGTSFFYIPGTDTCLRVGGQLLFQYAYISAKNSLSYAIAAPVTTAAQGVAAGLNPGTPVLASFGGSTAGFSTGKSEDTSGTRTQLRISLDARTQTDIGTVRTVIQLYGRRNSGLVNSGTAAGALTASGLGTGYVSSAVGFSASFVQFAGFTVGYAGSFLNFFADANMYELLPQADATVNLVGYTATFGNGVSASLSIEDKNGHIAGAGSLLSTESFGTFNAAGLLNGAAGNPNGAGFVTTTQIGTPIATYVPGSTANMALHGGVFASPVYKVPDLVANVRIDQAWGSAQLSGLLHYNQTIANAISGTAVVPVTAANPFGLVPVGTNFLTGAPAIGPAAGAAVVGANTNVAFNGNVGQPSANIMGYGAQLGVEINLPMLAAGDQLWIQGAFANGALSAIGLAASDDVGLSQGTLGRLLSGLQRTERDVWAVANVSGTNYSLQRERGFTALISLLHYWTPTLRQNFSAWYGAVQMPGAVKNTPFQLGGQGNAHEVRFSTSLIYTPVAGLDIGVEVLYAKMNQNLPTGTLTTSGAAAFLPAGTPVFGVTTGASASAAVNPSAVEARFRVQRDF